MSQRFRVPSFAGLFAMAALLSGCVSGGGGGTTIGGGGSTGTTGTLAAGGAANVYALEDTTNTSATGNDVLTFPAASSGNSTVPSLTLPLSTLVPFGVALDGSGNLYVSGQDDTTFASSVNVYAAGAASGATPVRSFSTNSSFQPVGIAVTSSGQAYVLEGEYNANGNVLAAQIEVFAPGAAAGSTPTATIAGSATQLIDPQDIAVDAAGNVYVANYQDDGVSQILVFAAGASGSVAPTRTITFNNEITGIAVDSSMNMYVAELTSYGTSSIVEYAAGGNGTPTASRSIAGTATGLNAADSGVVRVDAAGNIWLIQQSAVTGVTYFNAWPPSANGNVAPAVTFAPPSLSNPNAAFAVR